MAQVDGVVVRRNILDRLVFPSVARSSDVVLRSNSDLRALHRDSLQAQTLGEFLGLGTSIIGAAALYSHINTTKDIFGSLFAAAGVTSLFIALYAAKRDKKISLLLKENNDYGVP